MSSYIKLFILSRIPNQLPENVVLFYWLLLSRLQHWFSGRNYIKSIKTVSLDVDTNILEVVMTDGKIYIQSTQRISRFWRGYNYAMERLFYQYLPRESKLLVKFENKESLVIFDVGANIGEFSLACAEFFKESIIFAFEPDPKAMHCLQRNVHTRKLENRIACFPIALSNSNEKKRFYIATDNADSSFVKPTKTSSQYLELESMRLDDFLESADIKRVDLLKMDAEGHEPEVLSGFTKNIQNLGGVTVDVSPEREGEDTELEVKEFLTRHQLQTQLIFGQGQRKFLMAFKDS
jgi:FkbM family methyltransferase